MKNLGLQALHQNIAYKNISFYALPALHCLTGSVFIALMSQLSLHLPFTPIPITLQTLAVFLLIVAQGRIKATYSVMLYLAQASAGLPVLAGGLVNPAWMLFPTAGYLVGFIGCTLVAGTLLQKKENPSFLWTLFSIASGQVILFVLGASYLSYFVGVENAIAFGVVPFLYGAALKVLAAACSRKPIQFVSACLNKKK